MRRLAVALAVGLVPSGVVAQTAAVEPATARPAWLTAWSPLLSRGDMTRSLPGAPGGAVPLLLLPAPTAGFFWTTGNPAALASDMPDARTDFNLGLGGQSGSYHRPLDPAALKLGALEGSSWGRITPKNPMVGRVLIERRTDRPGSRGGLVDPHASTPFTPVDTSISDLRRNRVVLEGASAWDVGEWSAGLAIGLEARSHESVEAAVVRRSSRTMPGFVAGLTRRLGALEVGLQGGLRFRAENVRLYERSAETRAYELSGYQEVKPFQVSSFYERWVREYVPTFGAGVGNPGGAIGWSLSVERVWTREQQFIQARNDPATDRWDANGWRGALAVAPRSSGRLRAIGFLRYQGMTGSGDLGTDSAATIFSAQERRVEATTELRLAPKGDEGVVGVAVVGLRYEQRKRADSLADLRTDIRGLTPSLQFEFGYQWPRGLVAATLAVSHFRPTAELPDPATLGTTYRTFLAPELDVYTRAATPYAFGGLGRFAINGRSLLWMSIRKEHLAPSQAVGRYSWSPTGSRSSWGVLAGVTLIR